ncbi:MAG: TIGR03960 family B12-binding radical SAM protein [Candidatus Omnitrophica bacterium]|nr:TIGR03960 family B12-binding radical SAM protein [Candidatus Omnitrophota bacterium]
MIDFLQFQRPQRYIGNEFNVIKKTHQGRIPVCLCFPDLYEIGMSNLGLHIVYGLLNRNPQIVCERVFMPGLDVVSYLEKKKIKLFSLETHTSLDRFEIIGFNLGHELNYTNFLKILDLGGIPVYSKDREKTIVLAGGVINPEPIADFVDVFCLGEFEEISESFINIMKTYNLKSERLKALSEIEGFYVPAFYNIEKTCNKYRFEKKYSFARIPLKRRHVKDLDRSFMPFKWLTPHTEITHDRIPVEIARGCPHRCTFCQARAVYFPYRERKISTIKKAIEETYKYSGYENMSLLALSASDHSKVIELIEAITPFLQARRIGLNLPSLRVGQAISLLQKKLTQLKKTPLTVAIEAAKDDLRRSLNKNIDIEELFEAIKILKSLGTRNIKVYFMFGFHQEDEEDLAEIGKFLNKLYSLGRTTVNVSINSFIPKPLSLWQDLIMEDVEQLYRKRQIILKNIPKNRNFKITFSDPKKSILESILANGDRTLSAVLLKAFKAGIFFDSHGENKNWHLWEQIFELEKVDFKELLKSRMENFPWSHIN